MTLEDLIDRLELARDEHGGDTEVRLAIQPNYPLVVRTDSGGILEEDGKEPVFIIAAGEHVGYGNDEMWALEL